MPSKATLKARRGGRPARAAAGKQRATATRRAHPPAESRVFRMRIALYEPDIPQNTGTILRLCACLGIEADIIEPAGFPVTDRAFRRAGMDYLDAVAITRHRSWQNFAAWRSGQGHRLVLFTTGGVPLLSGLPLPGGRHPAVRTRIGGRAGGGPRRGRCPPRDPDAPGPAFAQCRGRRRHGRRRSAAADRRDGCFNTQ